MDELRGFHTAFRACFARQEPRDQFFNYMVGQFSPLERKAIEPMALQVEGGKVRAILAAAMVRALHTASVLPFTYIVADCLYGNSPDFWAACEACVGTVALVATPADTRCWFQPLATTTHTYT